MSNTEERPNPSTSDNPGGPEGGQGGGREAARVEQLVVRHDRLNRDGPMLDDDLIIVEGRDGCERTMGAALKRLKIEGVVAAPLVEVTEGRPHSISWTVIAARAKAGGGCFKDGRYKWSGPATLVFKVRQPRRKS